MTLKMAFYLIKVCITTGYFKEYWSEAMKTITDAGLDIDAEYEAKINERDWYHETNPVRFIDRHPEYTVFQGDIPVYKTYNRKKADEYWEKLKEKGINTYMMDNKGWKYMDTDELPF